ncbi:hypothetical protein [Niabella hibiscisoli]|uniref:hypothetical protein n=1 Tax=Niabella hibiscisoli TaxID=1825928 RepID=UPI001F0D601C|nr:hypothetical protein [Niabella hibiscisoli]MCH5716109.1 hypothetical protein [Niabella hibiscisoli]
MVRIDNITKYELMIRNGLQEIFNIAKLKMQHSGDLLLCQQNGNIMFNKAAVGLGTDGVNNFQKVNSIISKGIEDITDDDNLDSIRLDGTTEFELSLHKEKANYLSIWENNYFLRILTQMVNVASGSSYDWTLDMSKLTPNGKNKHIREQIINRLGFAPNFRQSINEAYNRNVRNAIAHSQYRCVQGGIIYDNHGSDKYANLEGLCFEDWEKMYVMSYFLFAGIFQSLKQIKDEIYIPLIMKTIGGGVPVRVYDPSTGWFETYLYPNKGGDVWRFTKTRK